MMRLVTPLKQCSKMVLHYHLFPGLIVNIIIIFISGKLKRNNMNNLCKPIPWKSIH